MLGRLGSRKIRDRAPLAGGLPSEIHVRDRRDRFEILVVFVLDDSRLAIDRVAIAADDAPAGTTEAGRLLERLPLVRYRREAARIVRAWSVRGEGEEIKLAVSDPVEQAAAVYQAHDGWAPTRAVADELGIPYETARWRVRAARARGLLPATRQGRRSR